MLRRILTGGGRDAERAVVKIGDEFYRAADDVPDMFQRGRKYALTDPGLEQQFGVRIDRSLGRPGTSAGYGSGFFYPPHGANADGGATLSVSDYPEMAKSRWDTGRVFGTAEDFGELPKNTRFAQIGAYDLHGKGSSAGAGEGKGVYAAMYGSLLQDPRVINYTSALTKRNAHRRSYNQAAALLRDPRLAKQIMVDPDQLTNTLDAAYNPMVFRRRSPEEQVGRLQSEGALSVLERLEKLERHPETFDDARPHVRDLLKRGLAKEEDPGYFARAADMLRRTGGPSYLYDTIGASALRRAALLGDIVEGDRVRRNLFSGLEFAQGGPVRRE